MVHGRVLTVERGRGGGEEGTDDDMECVGVEDGRSSSAVSESRPSGRCACLPGDTLAGGLEFLADGRRTSTVDGSTGLGAEANGAKSMVGRRWTRMLHVFCLAGVAAQSDGPFAVGTVVDSAGEVDAVEFVGTTSRTMATAWRCALVHLFWNYAWQPNSPPSMMTMTTATTQVLNRQTKLHDNLTL